MKSIAIDKYPATYKNILTPEQRIRLVAWFKMKQNHANESYKQANSYSYDSLDYVYYKNSGDMTMKEINGAIECLQNIGIMMEYGWVGHREEWFLATQYDAELQDDYMCDCY